MHWSNLENMKKLFLIFIFMPILLESTDRKNSTTNWTEYLGIMNWNEANQKCKKLGMRLPSRSDWLEPYNSDQRKSWRKPNGSWFSVYWTSEEVSGAGAYVFSLEDGDPDRYAKDMKVHVRCIRLK